VSNIDDLLEDIDPYTRDQFDTDYARIVARLCEKHGISSDEIDALIREHRYEHSGEDPEQEYIEIMTMARVAGWEVGPRDLR